MNSNLYWCIVGLVGGAITNYLFGKFFYNKGLTIKRLTYKINTFYVTSKQFYLHELIDIMLNSDEHQDLYCSIVLIDNIGNSIITNQDVAFSCPISILTTGQFLNGKDQCILLYPKTAAPNFDLTFYKAKNCVKFNFDYIPKKSHIKIKIFHTGDISFNGALMDGEIIAVNDLRLKKIKSILYYSVFTIIEVVLIISFFSLHPDLSEKLYTYWLKWFK